eukprot:CAMPEP_0181134738 /NCGR_PEP_ID=MMETSP1071-20121207/32250_1 /TAXON_ID=35127 /ORGANISM="Thalassiosira sp., Strain NH16" /LENGTH=401 /DNA_ID=CAMNT_0023221281 /DNA_START=131 /DNA_END=1337 /DNA_ORIENTATION=-
MSRRKGEESPSLHSTSPGGQYQSGNYPTTSNAFYPPPLPPLPGPYQPGLHHHHFFSHGNNGSPVGGEGSIRDSAAQLAALRGMDNDSFGRYTTPALTPTVASMNQHYYGSGLFKHVPQSANAPKNSPYFSPLPAASVLPASPEDRQGPPKAYRNSPYFSHEKDFVEPPTLDTGSGSSESSTSTTVNRPPAKSAFMCFSEARGDEISAKKGAGSKGFVEAVAAEWRSISKQERGYWEGMARDEKTRFAREKEVMCRSQKGPQARKLRSKKNPLAPKRPMSAFLMYAQQRRRPLQLENPNMPNADISRLLGELWRNTSKVEKRPFLEREEVERRIYKAKMEGWKNNQKLEKSMKTRSSKKKLDQRDQRQDVASYTREESHPSQRFVDNHHMAATPYSLFPFTL